MQHFKNFKIIYSLQNYKRVAIIQSSLFERFMVGSEAGKSSVYPPPMLNITLQCLCSCRWVLVPSLRRKLCDDSSPVIVTRSNTG